MDEKTWRKFQSSNPSYLHVTEQSYDILQYSKIGMQQFPFELIYWIPPKIPTRLDWVCGVFKSQTSSCQSLSGARTSEFAEEASAGCHVHGRRRFPCSSARARLGAHQPNVKPSLQPEYQLSTCQKDSEEEPLTEVLFALLFYFFFIYQVSLPARTWYLKIEGLCDSLTVSVTGSHHVLLLELGLRLSNRNSGKLNVTAEWAFSKEGS